MVASSVVWKRSLCVGRACPLRIESGVPTAVVSKHSKQPVSLTGRRLRPTTSTYIQSPLLLAVCTTDSCSAGLHYQLFLKRMEPCPCQVYRSGEGWRAVTGCSCSCVCHVVAAHRVTLCAHDVCSYVSTPGMRVADFCIAKTFQACSQNMSSRPSGSRGQPVGPVAFCSASPPCGHCLNRADPGHFIT